MPYAPFFAKFREPGLREMRTLISLNDAELPPGNYHLIDAYCDEPGCDCRRVFLMVYREETRTYEAVIAFGWETREFYAQWMGDDDPQQMEILQGPVLNLSSERTPLSDLLLERVKAVLKDETYVERLKRHYQMYRAEVDREAGQNSSLEPRGGQTAPRVKVGRNEACPCGSGRKYKRCCGG